MAPLRWSSSGIVMARRSPGATASTHVITPFTAEHAGLYHVTVSNEAGSVTSNKVQLVPVKSPTKATVTVNIAVGTVNP
jgi:hypothetical protein